MTRGPAAVRRRSACRLCSGGELQPVLRLAPTPVADAYLRPDQLDRAELVYPLEWVLCRGCGHVQLRDTVDPRVLFGDYVFVTGGSLGLVDHFRRLAASAAALFRFEPGSLAVDIGSNDGSLLRALQGHGLRTLGVDPARAIARQASAAGIETIESFFDESVARAVRAERGPASLVTAMNVFAHIDAMDSAAEGVRGLLAPEGVFIFEVSYLLDILDGMLFDTIYHEHLSYHSVGPLSAFLQRHGLRLFNVERIPTKGGSLRGYAQPLGASRPVAPVVGELLALEKARGLDRPEVFEDFARRIDAAKAAALSIVDGWRARGRPVAGYGASVTVTTLLHHFELGTRLDFLVDDNPAKQGTFSPGYRLAVLAPSALYARRPELVVLLAWQYADPLMKRHPDYAAGGGKFLVPLPEPRLSPAA